LKRKHLALNVVQRHRAEEDLAVAAASILARESFLLSLEQLGQQYGVPLPKGAANQVIIAGKLFTQKHGRGTLEMVGKLHFKTASLLG
jgi:ribonuclease HIII